MTEIHLESLLGRPVIDAGGMVVGRIEEIRAEFVDGEWRVMEYLTGSLGLLERLSLARALTLVLRVVGIPGLRSSSSRRIPWDQIDLSDPNHLRMRPLANARQ
jgi:hypothetical protein